MGKKKRIAKEKAVREDDEENNGEDDETPQTSRLPPLDLGIHKRRNLPRKAKSKGLNLTSSSNTSSSVQCGMDMPQTNRLPLINKRNLQRKSKNKALNIPSSVQCGMNSSRPTHSQQDEVARSTDVPFPPDYFSPESVQASHNLMVLSRDSWERPYGEEIHVRNKMDGTDDRGSNEWKKKPSQGRESCSCCYRSYITGAKIRKEYILQL